MRWLKRCLLAFLVLLLLVILAVAGLVVGLNTHTGQQFAVQQINKFGKNYVHLGGLSGRFPSDLKIPNLQLVDSTGVWLSATQIELDWSPLALLRRHLAIKALTAQTIDIGRPPAYPPAKHPSKGGGFSIPKGSVALNHLEIGTLHIGAALAGQSMTFHVTGHAALPSFYHADLAFDATSEPDIGSYHLAGTLTPQNVSLNLAIHELPGGLLGHFITPTTQLPLDVTAKLSGPRNSAILDGAATYGPAKLALTGLLALNQAAPSADIQISTPALAPWSTLTTLPVDGTATLHLTVAKLLHKSTITFSTQGGINLTKAPEGLDKLLVGRTTFDMTGYSRRNHITLQALTITNPGFSLYGSGVLGKKHINLTARANLARISDLLPQLKGQLALRVKLIGPSDSLRADADLTGQIETPGAPSNPFLISLRARNLPNAPYGKLTGSGDLAGAPLSLNALFVYNPKATSHIKLRKLLWKSLTAQADLKLKAGAKLPTGRGQVSITQLSDLNTLLGSHLNGAITTDFAYQENQALILNVTAHNAGFGKELADLNGSFSASGELNALALKLDARAAQLMGQPASTKLAGNLNLPAQTLNLASLTTTWHGLSVRLTAPAEIAMKPDITVQHLNLNMARTSLMLDGTLSPTLNAKISLKNLDLSLLQRFAPTLNTAGLVTLNATLTGSYKAPQGRVTLQASGLRYITPTTAALPPASLSGTATLNGQNADMTLTLAAGPQFTATLRGKAPFTMSGPMNLTLASNLSIPVLNPLLASSHIQATGSLLLNAHLTGTPKTPVGLITLAARDVRSETGTAAAIPPANLDARANVNRTSVRLNATLEAGPNASLSANGMVPLELTHAIALDVAGRVNLQLLDPILAADGNLVHGIANTSLRVTGTARSPQVNGTLTLADGSILNVGSGLNLTDINATISAADKLITVQSLSATAGSGKITGHGTVDLSGPAMPVNLALNADHATPIASDLLTETLNAALTLQGGLKTDAILGGTIDILKANINIPRSLPPSVANLPIHYEGEAPAAAKAPSSSIPPIRLALNLRAENQIFIRGDGLFAELGGHVAVGGTTASPLPTGGFSLIRGNFSLAGKTLEFTKGMIEFTGDGFIPALDLEATSPTSNGGSATLMVSGTAAKPKIGLSSSPPLPSDEILAQLLFAQSSDNLSPFQAASLAAALAQISGIGGGFSPLDSTRHALGLDQLSVGDDGKGGPSVQAGRYVAPGVYVGASQSTTGQGSKANVEINLYKGLKLQSSTGTDSTGQSGSSVGLSYQFNY